MTEKLYDVYELVDHAGEVHYTYTTHDEDGRSNLEKLNVRSYKIIGSDGCLDFGSAQTRMWERTNGRELPDLLEE
ncbi:hypothetical protein J4443_03790 [Candidatus Woesearchaeota archaeon]|nr:hypothetical protein [Candidatus Woesearchaeota archaeon]